MQMWHRRVAGIARQADLLAAGYVVPDFDESTAFLQMIILAGRAVVVKYDDVVRVAAAAVFPAADRVRFL